MPERNLQIYSTRVDLLSSIRTSTRVTGSMLHTLTRCALMGTLLWIGPTNGSASSIDPGATAFTSITGTGWVLNTGIRLWFVQAQVAFGHPAFGPFLGPVASPVGDKNTEGATQVRATPNLPDPDLSGAFGFGSGFVSPTSIGVFTINYDWGVTATAVAVPGPHNTWTRAQEIDPVQFSVGSSGSGVTEIESLTAGTEVQSPVGDAGASPELTFDGRFGPGAYGDQPAAFWATAAPPGVSDMFLITIFENASHHIDASVTLDGSNPDFSIAFTQSAAEIENAIRSADWTLSGGVWTLGSDLPLMNVTITSLSSAEQGMPATLGNFLSDDAVDIVPEPASILTAGASLVLICLGLRRIRRATVRERLNVG